MVVTLVENTSVEIDNIPMTDQAVDDGLGTR